MMLRPLSFAAAGLAVFAIGCSDAPARPAKLGLYVIIKNPSDPSVANRQCPASTGIEWDIGKTIKDNSGKPIDVDSPTPTDFGATLEDGQSNAEIECTVRKSGSFMSTGGGIDPVITPPNGRINFDMSGAAKPGGSPQTNAVGASFYTPVTFQIRTTSALPSCFISAVHELAAGALWASFECPALTEPTSPDVACSASGTIVMEYCKTGEEED
jgi:hypothetical protein